jgi:hypothetical protein
MSQAARQIGSLDGTAVISDLINEFLKGKN